MTRSALRFTAFLVLALLGAPVAMHVVMHDLHAHHEEAATAAVDETGHGDHEHPIVASPAPQLPDVMRIALPAAIVPTATAAVWTSVATNGRNVLSSGAVRMDDDVGLQPLLSTFLI